MNVVSRFGRWMRSPAKRRVQLIEALESRRLLHGGGAVFSINVGGGQVVDSLGTTWEADRGGSGGTVVSSQLDIAGTTDDAIYSSRRYGASFSYSLPVANGAYVLELRFADPFWNDAGKRKFNVQVEGSTVLSNFDIVAEAGPKTAIDKTFNINITDGKLDLLFTKIADNAIVSGIELTPIVPVTKPAAPGNLAVTGVTSSRVSLSWKDNADNESEFSILRSTDNINFADIAGAPANATTFTDTAAAAGTTYYYRVRAENAAGSSAASNTAVAATPVASNDPALVRVNAAGNGMTDSSNHVWSADRGFSGGTVSTAAYDVQNTVDDYLYYTRRIGSNFSYSLPVANGNYTLRLFFADPFWNEAGKRLFNVKAEGKSILTNYDIIADVGVRTAAVKSFNISITDGRLDLQFSKVLDNAIISGIVLLPGAPTQSNSITWTEGARAEVARFETQGTEVNGRIYVFGGFDLDLNNTTHGEYYDTASNTWRPMAPMPQPLTHAGVAVVGTTIWVVGGWLGHPGVPIFGVKNVWKYDTLTDSWSAGPSLPVERGGGQLVNLNGSLHYFGGTNGDRTQESGDHWVLRPGSTTWQPLASLPLARNHLGSALLDGKIYAIGGALNHEAASINLPYLQRYDPATDTWTRLADMPMPRSHINNSVMVINGRIVVAGGDSQTQISSNYVTAYDPATNTWTAMTPLPVRRMAGVAKYVGGRIFYLVGNGAGETSNRSFIGDLV